MRAALFDPAYIDREAVTYFTRGQCMVLAAVISQLTGLPFVTFTGRMGGGINHAVVEVLPELYGDACGVGTIEQHRACNGARNVETIASGQAARDWVEQWYEDRPRSSHRPNWPVAEAATPAVMRMWMGDERAAVHAYWPRTAEQLEQIKDALTQSGRVSRAAPLGAHID